MVIGDSLLQIHQYQHRYLRDRVSLASNDYLQYGVVVSYLTISFFRSLIVVASVTTPLLYLLRPKEHWADDLTVYWGAMANAVRRKTYKVEEFRRQPSTTECPTCLRREKIEHSV